MDEQTGVGAISPAPVFFYMEDYMPTYQYRCNACAHEFEVFQTMTADPVSDCPECEGDVTRLISGGAGFLFKGDGFYTTDYRSDGYKKAEKADKEASTPKSDSKSDASKSDKSTSSKSDSSASKSDSSKSSKSDS